MAPGALSCPMCYNASGVTTMALALIDKLANVAARYNELLDLMAQPEIATDPVRLQQYVREQRDLNRSSRRIRRTAT